MCGFVSIVMHTYFRFGNSELYLIQKLNRFLFAFLVYIGFHYGFVYEQMVLISSIVFRNIEQISNGKTIQINCYQLQNKGGNSRKVKIIPIKLYFLNPFVFISNKMSNFVERLQFVVECKHQQREKNGKSLTTKERRII